MKAKTLSEHLKQLYPKHLAQDWDNTGFLVGDIEKNIKNILLTIDITEAVLAEAKKNKADIIVSYHPVIWDGLKTVTANGPGGIVYNLIRAGICVYSIHTSLDVADGGVNDGLAEIVGIENPEPIGDYVDDPSEDLYKLVVFIPHNSAERVASAVFKAGAGHIGNYSCCGFTAPGQGSFLPLENAHPAIGKKGKLEKVDEVRFESVVPADKLNDCVDALKKTHPYEMPAFDCFKMANPKSRTGLGRIGTLKKSATVTKIIKNIKTITGARFAGVVGKENRIVKKAAVCAGSCGKIIDTVIARKCDLYLTGEIKHHQALAAREAGLTCLCLSHSNSERFIIKKLAKQLQNRLKNVTIRISKKDADPFIWKQI